FTAGSDIWTPVDQDPQLGCSGTAGRANDYAHVCETSSGNTPYDDTTPVSLQLIDQSTDTPRFDFLFVVTPPSVTRADMDPSSSSNVSSIYTPVRFMSPGDCNSPDPDNPLT